MVRRLSNGKGWRARKQNWNERNALALIWQLSNTFAARPAAALIFPATLALRGCNYVRLGPRAN